MKWSEWLDEWGMTSLKIKAPFLDMEFKPKDEDKAAAWEMYIELLTRVTTQPLYEQHGDEKTALKSIYDIFSISRECMKSNGHHCIEFTKIAIVMLNQVIRPFTAKWHRLSLEGAFNDQLQCNQFSVELKELQSNLNIYTRMLSDMAGVEDLTEIENNND